MRAANPKLQLLRIQHTKRKEKDKKSKDRASAEILFVQVADRLRHWGYWPELRLSRMRAVIDDPFISARMNEGILSYRFGGHIHVPLDIVDEVTIRMCQKQRKAEDIYSEVRSRSRGYRMRRTRTKHLSWKKK